MDISILIATYKRPFELSRTLEALTQIDHTGLTWQIILVDNANDPQTFEVFKKYQNLLPIKYAICSEQGKSRALNVGLPLCEGDLIILTDDDVLPEKSWLKETLEGAKRWPNHSIWGGKVIPDNINNIPQEYRQLKHFILDYAVADWKLAEGPYSPYEVFGPNFAIRKNILKENIRFNPEVGVGAKFPTGVETFFLLDLHKKGYEPVYLPKSIVYHQIRPEQLTLKWLYERSFKGGRTDVYENQKLKTLKLFGIPRYLIKKLFLNLIQCLKSSISFNKIDKIETTREYYRTRGQIYQYWKIRND